MMSKEESIEGSWVPFITFIEHVDFSEYHIVC